MTPTRIPVLLWRVLTRTCPNCGGRPVFAGYWRVRENCPSCGIRLERGEQGYIVGTYMFNLVASELIFAAVMITWVLQTWPEVPWDAVQYVGVGLMILLPIVFYPFARSLFLSAHLYIHPTGDTDR